MLVGVAVQDWSGLHCRIADYAMVRGGPCVGCVVPLCPEALTSVRVVVPPAGCFRPEGADLGHDRHFMSIRFGEARFAFGVALVSAVDLRVAPLGTGVTILAEFVQGG